MSGEEEVVEQPRPRFTKTSDVPEEERKAQARSSLIRVLVFGFLLWVVNIILAFVFTPASELSAEVLAAAVGLLVPMSTAGAWLMSNTFVAVEPPSKGSMKVASGHEPVPETVSAFRCGVAAVAACLSIAFMLLVESQFLGAFGALDLVFAVGFLIYAYLGPFRPLDAYLHEMREAAPRYADPVIPSDAEILQYAAEGKVYDGWGYENEANERLGTTKAADGTIQLGREIQRRVFVNRYGPLFTDLEKDGNGHAAYVGMGKSGKTTLAEAEMGRNYIAKGITSLVLDHRGEWAETAEALGGRVLRFGLRGPDGFTLNPLALGGLRPSERAAKFAEDMIWAVKLTELQAGEVEDATMEAYRRVGIIEGNESTYGEEPPTIADLLAVIDDWMSTGHYSGKEKEWIRFAVRKIRKVRRIYGDERDDFDEMIMRGPVVVIDFHNLHQIEERALVLLTILSRLIERFGRVKGGRGVGASAPLRVLVWIEEAHWVFGVTQDMGAITVEPLPTIIAREGRKSGIGLQVITQSPDDIPKLLATNLGTIFAFKVHTDEEKKKVYNWHGLTKPEQEIFDQFRLERGDCYAWSANWKYSKPFGVLRLTEAEIEYARRKAGVPAARTLTVTRAAAIRRTSSEEDAGSPSTILGWECSNCGQRLKPGASFCDYCGAQLAGASEFEIPPGVESGESSNTPRGKVTARCESCDAEILEGENYCGDCGRPRTEIVSAEAAPPPTLPVTAPKPTPEKPASMPEHGTTGTREPENVELNALEQKTVSFLRGRKFQVSTVKRMLSNPVFEKVNYDKTRKTLTELEELRICQSARLVSISDEKVSTLYWSALLSNQAQAEGCEHRAFVSQAMRIPCDPVDYKLGFEPGAVGDVGLFKPKDGGAPYDLYYETGSRLQKGAEEVKKWAKESREWSEGKGHRPLAVVRKEDVRRKYEAFCNEERLPLTTVARLLSVLGVRPDELLPEVD